MPKPSRRPRRQARSEATDPGFGRWAGDACVSGPSYSLRSRVLLALFLVMMGILASRGQTWSAMRQADPWVAVIFVLAFGVVLAQCWAIFRGRTRIDDLGISQTGLWLKRVEWSEVRSARFLGMPWVSGFIPPKLVLRTYTGRYVVFQGGTPALHEAFAHAVVTVQSGVFLPQEVERS